MEPGLNAPRMNPEQGPSLPPVAPEVLPGVSPEQAPERERQYEQKPAPQQEQLTAPPVAVPALPAPVVDDTAADDTGSLLSAVPDVAADDDLIEKEWVDKAKRIITETAEDPYRREQAIKQLQREYLRKRYGKEVGASG